MGLFPVRKLIVLAFCLLLGSLLWPTGALAQIASTATTPGEIAPGVSTAQWHQLIDKILASGPPVLRSRGYYKTLTRITPKDETRPHHAEYISTVGRLVGSNYQANEILQVSEDWTIDKEGNWEIDQYFFDVSIAGELLSENHMKIVQTPDSEVLQDVDLPNQGKNDPAILAHWADTLQAWLK